LPQVVETMSEVVALQEANESWVSELGIKVRVRCKGFVWDERVVVGGTGAAGGKDWRSRG